MPPLGSGIYGSETGGLPPVAVSKNTTYLQVMDLVRIQTNTSKNVFISDSLLLKQIQLTQQIIQARTPEIYFLYQATVSSLPIIGGSNPYVCDLSSINPYVLKAEKFIHLAVDGTRTDVMNLDVDKAENLSKLSMYDTSLLGSYRGDVLELFAGSSFTVSATDTIIFKFIRQTLADAITSADYIDLPDSLIQTLVNETSAEIIKYAK